MAAILYRLRQGLRALLSFATTPDLAFARCYLTQREFAAFTKLSRADQLHSIYVLRRVLRAEPHAPSALAAAALLHDVGKSRFHLAVWQKTLAVLLRRLAPGLSQQLSKNESLGKWRAPFVVQKHHPSWSVDILRECGSDSVVIWLAEHHHADIDHCQEHRYASLLRSLQAADN